MDWPRVCACACICVCVWWVGNEKFVKKKGIKHQRTNCGQLNMHICKCFVVLVAVCLLAFVTGAAVGLPIVCVSVCMCWCVLKGAVACVWVRSFIWLCITYLCKQKLFNLNITFCFVAEDEARLSICWAMLSNVSLGQTPAVRVEKMNMRLKR